MIRDYFLFTALIPRARLKNHSYENVVKAMDEGTDVLFISEEVSAKEFLKNSGARAIGQQIAFAYQRLLERRIERVLQGRALEDKEEAA